MVRLNLLESPHTPRGVKQPPPAPEREPEEEKPEEFKFTFDSVEGMFGQPKEEGKPEVDLESRPIEEEETSEFLEEKEDAEPERFEEIFPRKRLYLILGILGGVVALGILLYVIFQFSGGEQTLPERAQLQKTPETPETQQAAAANRVQQYLSNNQQENLYFLSFAQKILGTTSPGTSFSLLIITPGKIYFSAIAESRDDIARLHMKLKDAFPGTSFFIESVQPKLIDGQNFLAADFSVNFGSRQQPARAEQVSGFPEKSISEVRSEFNRLASRHKLRVKYFKEGYRTRDQMFNKIYYYTTISGPKNAILNFLTQIAKEYPQISFPKIAIYPFNVASINSQQITARITLVLYNPI